jgi:hypothetical protein
LANEVDVPALNRTVNTALRDLHLAADVRAHLLVVRERVALLRALGELQAGLEGANRLQLSPDVLEQLPEPVRRLWRGLEGLQEIGSTLAGTSRAAPNPANLARRLADVQAATGNRQLTETLQRALIAKIDREGQATLAQALRDLRLEPVPGDPTASPHVPVPLLVPEPPPGSRPGPFEAVWKGLPELKGSATRASRELHQRLTAEVKWHSNFYSSLTHTQAHLAFQLSRQTESDERRARDQRRAALAEVEKGLLRRLTPAERIIAADMLRRRRAVEARADLQRFLAK